MTKKVVTFGELLVRLSTNVGERIMDADQLNVHYGGSEANVAINLAYFDYETYIVSVVPDHALGSAITKHLRAHGVNTDYVQKRNDRIGTYYLEAGAGNRSAQVIYDRKYTGFSKLAPEDIDFKNVFKDVSLLHVTGITPALAPNITELTLLFFKKAKENGVLTSFDFNYRSKLWNLKEAATAFKRFLPYIDICSFGELDAVNLLEMDKINDSIKPAIRLKSYYEQLQGKYPNIQSIYCTFRNVHSASHHTLQGNYFENGHLSQSKVYDLDSIVDRVGGGDAYAAGTLYGILEGMNPDQIVSFATGCSVLKHTIHGDANRFTSSEVQSFIENESGKINR